MKRLLVSISLLLLWTCLILAGPRVKIRNGRLEGSIMRSRKGRDIFAFRGIPYARPPVGELRFEPPQPAASWKGIRSAQDDGNICPQQEYMHIAARMIGSEDCLYLNVFTPELPGVSKKNIYPVLVWIHGGGWFVGSGSSKLYGPQYLLDYEIILVTLNYRLGPLGLLSTGDDVIPGNFAFKDQVLALHWVQENIAAFGGDPGRVTIAGDSAGGTSVHYLMLSRLARGLFHQAIAESGSAVNNWAYNPPNLSRNKTHRLAKELGCPVTTSQKIRDCLSKINASVINGQTAGWPVINGFPFLKFRPVLESNKSGAFLIDTAEELMKHGEFSDVPWLLGVNAQEGSIFTIGLYLSPDQRELKRFNDNFFDLAPILLQLDPACPKDDLKTICQKLRHYYLKNKIIDESNRRSFIDMMSDGQIKLASAMAAKLYQKIAKSSVYFYHFEYAGNVSFSPSDPKRPHGASHGDEVLYLFPHDEGLPEFIRSERDFEMVDVMTTLWTNFVISGKPYLENAPESFVEWAPVQSDAIETFMIESPTSSRMSQYFFKNMTNIWSSLPCRAGFLYAKSGLRPQYDHKLSNALYLLLIALTFMYYMIN